MKAEQEIYVRNSRVHNLKSVSVRIPHNELVVVTGLSGSGKSSLVFDTLFAEGQRRYIESLSSYARQFFGRMSKPDVDMISGLPPAIAIKQKVATRSPRSTVGTLSEIYDYLKLLYSRIGKTYSPVSGNIVKRQDVSDIVKYLTEKDSEVKVYICFSWDIDGDRQENWQENLNQQGFQRVYYKNKIQKLEDLNGGKVRAKSLYVVLDRFKNRLDDANISRLYDSAEMAFNIGDGNCLIITEENDKFEEMQFSSKFEEDGIVFEEPIENLFSFNSPFGACPKCEGYGMVVGVDEELVIPDKSLSFFDNCVLPWRGDSMSKWKDDVIMNAASVEFPVHRPYMDLSEHERELLWHGCDQFNGIFDFFDYVESKKYKIQYRVMLSRYRGKTICPDCKGKRLRKEATWVKIDGKSLPDLVEMPIGQLLKFIKTVKLDQHDMKIAERILTEVSSRLEFMQNVGLSYLTLNRRSATLSGGETQRINLVTSLGSSLVGSMYILDEPSIGLHPRDTHLLVEVLKDLRNPGNTVVVVEHEESVILEADRIIDIGPGAGYLGGEILFNGTVADIMKDKKSLTGSYLTGARFIPVPEKRKEWNHSIVFEGLRQNNLKIEKVEVPLQVMTVITGVSGSGKSTFIRDIMTPAIRQKLGDYSVKPGLMRSCSGDFSMISDIQYVDQNPIGKSSRSNPVTYIKAWDEIRHLYADQPLSKQRGYKPSYFSFNVDGGRCEACKGEGQVRVEMQFMADVFLVCDECNGRRFKDEILEVKYRDNTIFDILEMTINQAIDFFNANEGAYEKRIVNLLKNYQSVGLGYLKMGQSSNTLSGGESQRVKLAFFLSKEKAGPSMFVFDEPTTGLHFHDINKLLSALEQLKNRGHSIVIVEHNTEVIKTADWLIDLGPEGGDEGGNVVFAGVPEDIIKCEQSWTGKFLKNKIKAD
jgi:excinuclease ABC subunit A